MLESENEDPNTATTAATELDTLALDANTQVFFSALAPDALALAAQAMSASPTTITSAQQKQPMFVSAVAL